MIALKLFSNSFFVFLFRKGFKFPVEMKYLLLLLTFSVLVSTTVSVGLAVCIAACNAAAAACYAAAGLVIGTVTLGVGAPPAAIACSAGQGVCMTSCAAGGVSSGGMCSLM